MHTLCKSPSPAGVGAYLPQASLTRWGGSMRPASLQSPLPLCWASALAPLLGRLPPLRGALAVVPLLGRPMPLCWALALAPLLGRLPPLRGAEAAVPQPGAMPSCSPFCKSPSPAGVGACLTQVSFARWGRSTSHAPLCLPHCWAGDLFFKAHLYGGPLLQRSCLQLPGQVTSQYSGT